MKLKKYLKGCNEIYHTTLNPKLPGVCRIHLIPPKKLVPRIPWTVIVNGYSIIPMQSSWAILLKIFIENLNTTNGRSLAPNEIVTLIDNTIEEAKKIFPAVPKHILKKDLKDMVKTFSDLAVGKEPSEKIGYMTLSKYAKYMKSPHRMDLMVSAMTKEGNWNCNQNCLHCYASNEVMSGKNELDTESWKKIIDNCRKACMPALTFTGGEATMRKDLVELVDYSKWFVTRLNTNGILLTSELCKKLYDASLDSVQITLYSYDEETHNKLVGGNHFKQTVQGIKNAIESGLDVSINTPLCSLNKDYTETVKFAHSLGIRYFSCSGLIPTGKAKENESVVTKLSNEEITEIVKSAFLYTSANELELAFTSPGWIDEQCLSAMKMVIPSCGACLSNMAIAPDGTVIPCQSYLNGTNLGNMLTDKWSNIWNNPTTKNIRKKAVTKTQICLLREGD